MPKEKFNPTPAEQFGDEGLSNIHDDRGEDRITKGPMDEMIQKGIIAGRRDIRGRLRKSEDYGEKDLINLEQLPNTNEGKEINEEEKIIDIIATRQELLEREKRLKEGKANLISKPDSSQEKEIRQFNTVGELLEFHEKREKAKEKARERYAAEQNKKEDKEAA